MASLLDLLMRAPPTAEGDISDSLSTTASDPLLQAFIRLQAGRVKDAITAPRDAYRGDLQVFDPSTGHVSDEAMDRANGMAGLAMTGGLGGVPRGGTTVGAGPIRAYHGSPHDFDKFSMSAIGTGEGAQAYGHGLYFAGNETVARSYRDALRADPAIPDSFAQRSLDIAGGDRAGAIKDLKNKLYFADDPEDIARYTAAHDLLSSGRDPHIPQGHMYEVGIDADPAKLLDYDAAISGQAKGVQDYGGHLLNKMQEQGLMRGQGLSDLAGADFPYMTKRLSVSPAQVSSDLQALGIPGVKFLDAGSRWGTAGDQSHNYVTFSDDIVKILRKYGLAGVAALGAGGGAVSNLGMGASPQGVSY